MKVSKSENGFSLIEVLVVLGLTSVVLYSVALLTQRTLGTLNFLRSKSESTLSATLGCERLSSELRETVTTPSTGAELSFRKVNPSAPRAVGNDMPPSPPPAPPPPLGLVPSHEWVRLYPVLQTHQIKYEETGGNLMRQVNTDTPTLVASSVETFQADPVSGLDKTYKITLVVTENRKVMTYHSVVYCEGAP